MARLNNVGGSAVNAPVLLAARTDRTVMAVTVPISGKVHSALAVYLEGVATISSNGDEGV
jgi:hypothetical protein